MREMFEYGKAESIKQLEVVQPVPYVVSADIQILMQHWAARREFTLPNGRFFDDLRTDFAIEMDRIFPAFDFVEESTLTQGVASAVDSTELPAISLDRVYYDSGMRLDISRIVDENGTDIGLGRRRDAPPLLQQVRDLRSRGIDEAVLIDDVLFSGSLLERVSGVLERGGIAIPVVCTGIAIQEGIDRMNQIGKEVKAVVTYEDVIDEVCERDFYPGVPLSGRLVGSDENIGAPYILPFGNPGKWASIPPERQEEFSRFCIEQAVRLFESIEQASGRPVYCSDLDRRVVGLPQNGVRFVDALQNVL